MNEFKSWRARRRLTETEIKEAVVRAEARSRLTATRLNDYPPASGASKPGQIAKVCHEIKISKINPAPIVEFDLNRSAGWLKRMRKTAVFLCTIEWRWSLYNNRMESYFLQRSRWHWILWEKYYDDNWGRWEKPFAKARCPRTDPNLEKDIAITLLAAVLREEIRHYDSDPGRFDVSEAGLLDIEELNIVADTVWERHE
jgi:hypothetical protein